MLQKYAQENGFTNHIFFVDDGYNGTNFNRPDWQRFLGLIDKGQVGTIIVKDMSRLGRDYLQVGMYTEVVFLAEDIRFIAINSGVDSNNGTENDITPFINIFNEFYAKNISRKIISVFKVKGQSGKLLCTKPPYGYIKAPEDKFHWIVDPEGAKVVKEAFRLCIKGYGISQVEMVTSKTKSEFIKRQRERNREFEGKISDERFDKMTTTYEAEQVQMQKRVMELRTQPFIGPKVY